MTRSPPRVTTHWCARPQGKTTFLKFLLARLLSAHQVAILCGNDLIHLFYHGKVYYRPTAYGFKNAPKHRTVRYYPIVALIDVDFKDRGPPIDDDINIWPVQATSPNPIRWKSWRKQLDAALLGMPLWNKVDLVNGYVLNLFSLSTINPGHVVG